MKAPVTVSFILSLIMVTFSNDLYLHAQDKPCVGMPTVTYSGKIYNTVQIGNQCWLKENLDVGTMIIDSVDQTNNDTIEKYCYNNDPANCTAYGGLYQWNEAMQYTTKLGAKGICPIGWHIPTFDDIWTLKTTVSDNANALKAIGQGTGSGAGTNTSGFSAKLSGLFDFADRFRDLTNKTYFWSSRKESACCPYYIGLVNGEDAGDIDISKESTSMGLSVRCLKN